MQPTEDAKGRNCMNVDNYGEYGSFPIINGKNCYPPTNN
jgi:hypothetical protein